MKFHVTSIFFAIFFCLLRPAVPMLAGQAPSTPGHADAPGLVKRQTEAFPSPTPVVVKAPRERIIAAGVALLGTTEATGRNDGPVIEKILASVGLEGTGSPYCAATNRYVYDQAGLKNVGPRSAWAPDWVREATWKRGKGTVPKPGDTWGIYFPSKGRVAHTGMVREWRESVCVTIEGNTSPEPAVGEKDRDGDGVWSKRRLRSQIYAVRNWLD